MFYVFILYIRDMYFMYEINDNNNKKNKKIIGERNAVFLTFDEYFNHTDGTCSQYNFTTI